MTYVRMVKTKSKNPKQKKRPSKALRGTVVRWLWHWGWRIVVGWFALVLALIVLFRFINPPITITIWHEMRRLGGVDREWTQSEDIAPVMLRSVVAAEDANFCRHWGFDMHAIRLAIDEGGQHGASTISQQVVKNVFLWQGRNWIRKAMEAAITPMTEAIWSKRRILEIYLNVVEFDEGVFGINAAAFRYFRTTPDKLTARQAALLASVLPDPKHRDAAHPTAFLNRRAAAVEDGAETIRRDGRASCFE